MARSPAPLFAMVLSLATWTGCRLGPSAEDLHARAEALRLKGEAASTRQAAELLQAAADQFAAGGRWLEAARATQQLGAVHQQLGQLSASLAAYEQALSLALRTSDRRLQSEIGSDAGSALSLIATTSLHFSAAKTLCDEALAVAHEQGAIRQSARALQCLGDVAYYRQAGEEALSRYRAAGEALGPLNDPAATAQNLLLVGHVSSDLGRFDEARRCYERARTLFGELKDARQLAITAVAIGRLHARRGEYQAALDRFEGALEPLKQMGDVLWEGSATTGIAEVLSTMGDSEAALEYWERARELFEQAGLHNVSIDILISLGENYLALGDPAQALVRFERALASAETLGIERWRAYALRHIGGVHLFRGQPREARDFLERSRQVQKALGESAGYQLEAQTLNELGEAHRQLGNLALSATSLTRALALSRAAGDRLTQSMTLYTLARASLDRGDLTGARQRIEEALQLAESLRADVLHRSLRASYVASIYRWYELHVDVLMRLGEKNRSAAFARAAFEASERARARSLLEGIAATNEDPRAGVAPALLKREQAVLDGFQAWADRQANPEDEVGVEALAQEYRSLDFRWHQVQAEIRRQSSATDGSPAPLRLRDVQQTLLDDDTLLLEYMLGDERSYLWVVSRRGIITHTLPPRTVIEPLATRVYDLLTVRTRAGGDPAERQAAEIASDREYWDHAARLSAMLLGPVAGLDPGRRLVVVADGGLHYLPLAALPLPGRSGEPVPLLVEHEVTHIPSASAMLAQRATPSAAPFQKTLAVFADPVFDENDPRLPSRRVASAPGRRGPTPRLPQTAQEAEAIARLAGPDQHLKALAFDANRDAAMSPTLATHRIVHFATHALFDNRNPGGSGILLSQYDSNGRRRDGFLRLHDIFRLKLPVDLVVLSACNTALGQPIRGEGLIGMVRGFMHAGARRVVATHWVVDDAATGELMQRFYTEMLQRGRPPAAALRQAQLGMLHLERWRAPYYWAGFVVQGEWR